LQDRDVVRIEQKIRSYGQLNWKVNMWADAEMGEWADDKNRDLEFCSSA